MTVDEVVAAFPGEAVRASSAELEKRKAPVRIERCTLAGTEFRAEFYFYRSSQLTDIVLSPASNRDAARPVFDRLAKLLTEAYGPPKEQHDDFAIFGPIRQSDRSWEAADAHIGLVYLYGSDEQFLHVVYKAHTTHAADRN